MSMAACTPRERPLPQPRIRRASRPCLSFPRSLGPASVALPGRAHGSPIVFLQLSDFFAPNDKRQELRTLGQTSPRSETAAGRSRKGRIKPGVTRAGEYIWLGAGNNGLKNYKVCWLNAARLGAPHEHGLTRASASGARPRRMAGRMGTPSTPKTQNAHVERVLNAASDHPQ